MIRIVMVEVQPLRELPRVDGFEIVDGNSGLIADLAQAHASLLACESQLFADARCHLQSLDPWRWLD